MTTEETRYVAYRDDLLAPENWRADPFPHAVVDGLWNDDLLEAARREFPEPDSMSWKTYADPEERGKKAIDDPGWWGPAVTEFFRHANGLAQALTAMTGIADLTSDPLGGGMHETGEGGRLGMHVDFNYHPDGRVRRLNLLTYLNHTWHCDWGGCLYLGADRGVAVEPRWNRTVLFECGNASWHGHPDPVTDGHLRRSLATYYYTPPGSVDLGEAHTTIYRRD
jgi:hypothetical protein